MTRSLLTLALCAAALVPPPALSQEEIVCNSIYMVQPGDSLTAIAERAYGQMTAYRTILDYNRSAIGDPGRLPSGIGIYIPCLEDARAEGRLSDETR